MLMPPQCWQPYQPKTAGYCGWYIIGRSPEMNRRHNARQIEREKLLFRYSSALQRGDFEMVETVLREAQHDPALDELIAELNAAYEAELSAAHTILSPNHRYREDKSVNISVT
jgi:hypothetical protein